MGSSILIDYRWVGDHGIGRFAREMSYSNIHLTSNCSALKRGEGSPLDVLDLIRLRAKLAKEKLWFVSPSYNAPILWSDRSIVTIHDLMHLNFYRQIKSIAYYNLILKRVCRQAPFLFTVSKFTRNEIAEWANIDSEKIVVIPNAPSSNFNQNVIPFQSEVPYILYVGNRKRHKNVDGLLRAFSISNAQSDFVIYLSGDQDRETKSLIDSLGLCDKIRFTGHLSEEMLAKVYKGATMLILPSFCEGFGLPIVEAFAVGVPIVTSNVTAMPEIGGNAVTYIDPFSIESIANGIDTLAYSEILRSKQVELGYRESFRYSWESSRLIWKNSIEKLKQL